MKKLPMRLPKFKRHKNKRKLARQVAMGYAGFFLSLCDDKPTSKLGKKRYNKQVTFARVYNKRKKNDYWRNHWESLRLERNCAELEEKELLAQE